VTGASEVPTWILCGVDAPPARERELAAGGAEIIRVALDRDGHLDPRAALARLAERGITRVFTEGGPSLADCFARHDLLDEVVISTSPNVLGEPGRPAVGPGLRDALERRFRPVCTEMAGVDRGDVYERAV
jgi:diaminohydroxyphosphoribosylaminopyrimidine deaminase/5-amino-6-(5-phosphoribosylamino)uracil reductase